MSVPVDSGWDVSDAFLPKQSCGCGLTTQGDAFAERGGSGIPARRS